MNANDDKNHTPCTKCDGTGGNLPDCGICHGRGTVGDEWCQKCGGLGYYFANDCDACGGVGEVPE